MIGFFSTKNWNRCFLYILFICSTFSIAGIEASILILYLISLISWTRNRSISNFKNPLIWAIFFFMTVSVFSGLLNEYETDHLMALRTNWRLILPLLLAGILADVDENRLIHVFMGFVMLIAVYGIIQFFTGADWLRPDNQSFTTPYSAGNNGEYSIFHGKGNFSHHLTYGGYLLICFPLLCSLIFCKDWNLFSRSVTTIITIIVLIAMASSLGRSIWLGALFSTVILLFRLSPKIMFFLLIFVFAVCTYLYLQFDDPSFQISKPNSRIELVKKRFVSGFKLKSNQDRILMWESALAVIKDHFWLGIGYDNDAGIIPSYRKNISQRTGHRFWTKASTGVHNIYLQTWINYGLLGLLGFLSIFMVFLAQCSKTLPKTTKFSFENSVLWAGISGVCGFMVAGFFENNFRDGEVQAMLLILMGLCLHQIRKLNKNIV